MKKINTAIIGSGIGGSLASLAINDADSIIFEKSNDVGGCACTFRNKNNIYNAGATTLIGYEEGMALKKLLDDNSINLDIIKSKSPFTLRHNSVNLAVSKDFDKFLIQIDNHYPNSNNRLFWETVKKFDEKFWNIKDIHYSKYTIYGIVKSIKTFWQLLKVFKFHIFEGAKSFIKSTLGEIDNDYMDFLDSLLLITAQKKVDECSFVSMCLGLNYMFHDLYYANGGMGEIVGKILHDKKLSKNEKVLSIKSSKNGYILNTTKDRYVAKNVILNSTTFDLKDIFEDKKIKRYFSKFQSPNQSAFVTYIKLNIRPLMAHHYMIINKQILPYSISKSIFVSFSDHRDEKLSKNGLSITISTHTTEDFWLNLSSDEYKKCKQELEMCIVEIFLKNFDNIHKSDIADVFSATPKTFKRYILRSNCGGSTLNPKKLLSLASPTTPFNGLYCVGDSILAQGWSGVALNAIILKNEIENAKR